MALKRQQAAEDKIALHLASVETGTPLESLPPGRIYGMRVTDPSPSPGPEPDSAADDQIVSILYNILYYNYIYTYIYNYYYY